ncbi:hypothetical protein FSP39_002637 [Pinctada imbricata]|uniref:Uncharacterized protein n=1 Tax=Pinctada imbricata TaxID=66713 RepID=A0AA89C213_PINIB|nr:hypothetical protein FSP39_002637 [Pinctada imbricata]
MYLVNWIAVSFLLYQRIVQTLSCPTECFCSQNTVDCSQLDYTEIPSGIPGNVKILNLEGNQIKQIRRSDFQNLRKLVSLNLKGNEIGRIERNSFYRLRKLQTLDISDNYLRVVEAETFSKMPKLRTLNLANNKIESIEKVVTNLKSLNRLVLSNNHIPELTYTAFKGLPDLRYVSLDNNNISFIATNTFWTLLKLSFLNIRNNPLGNIDQIFRYNDLLTYIELTNCELSNFPLNLPPSVRYLQLGQNNIPYIMTSDISKYTDLQVLVLDNNEIEEIQDGSLQPLGKLIELWLSYNNLTEIPQISKEVRKFHLNNNKIAHLNNSAFPQGSLIEELYMQGNLLTSLETSNFENVPKLRKLNLGGNELKVFQDGLFSTLQDLEVLNVDSNDFHTMETEVFKGLNSLKELSMSRIYTYESAIQGNVFGNMSKLQRLDVQESPVIARKILNSKDMMASLHNLRELNMMDNEVASIDPAFKRNLPLLTSLKISGNPFHCDTRLAWLKGWIQLDPHIFYTPDFIECYSPPSLYGELISTLSDGDFVPTTLPPFYLTNQKTHAAVTTKLTNNSTISDIHSPSKNTESKPASKKFKNTNIHKEDNTQFLAIVISIPTVTLFLIVLTAAYFIYHRRKSMVFHKSLRSSVTNGMTVPAPPPARLTRQERGSVTSQTGEDITNNGSSKMKVYIWDN